MEEQNTDRKNQHYVPKFYLRNFSIDGNGKQIKLYNVKRSLYVKAAPIKSQASSSFYYGKNGEVEEALSELEGNLAKIVKEVITTEDRFKYKSHQHLELLTFIVSTDLRNPIRAKAHDKLTDSVVKQSLSRLPYFRDNPERLEILDQYEITDKDSSTVILQHLENGIQMLGDLHIKILKNCTNVPFITSDNPVVRYNQFLEQRSSSNSITGLGNTGLQLFVPLTEKIALILYDEQIYHVGGRRSSKVSITDVKDMEQLNLITMANCNENVYGGVDATEVLFKKLAVKTASFPAFHQLHHSSTPSIDKKGGVITMHTVDSIKTQLNVSFINFTGLSARFNILSHKIYIRSSASQYMTWRDQQREQEKRNRKT